MKKILPVTTLFTDVGGVLLTNGWGRSGRKSAIEIFDLDPIETEERHHLTFDTYEVGKLNLDQYLDRVVFYKKRKFSKEDFRQFMFQQSQPYPDMIALMKTLRKKNALKIAVVNNEGYELNCYRISTFKLNEFADFFISSCFVHFRKPDADIFKLAMDVAQVSAEQAVYIDDRPMFVKEAERLGLKGIVHSTHADTVKKLAGYGLKV